MRNELWIKAFGTDEPAKVAAKKGKEAQRDRSFLGKQPEPVSLTKEKAQKLCKDIGLQYQNGYESRVLEYTITNETVDRYGDIVRAKGVSFTNYRKNPVINFAHNTKTFPVGNTVRAWHDKDSNSIKAWGLFFDERIDKTGMADTVFRFAASGAMKACSIGFMPIETNEPDTNERKALKMPIGGVEFVKSDLLEWSPVSVPANPDAVQNALEQKQLSMSNIRTAQKYKLFDDALFEKIGDLLDKSDDKTDTSKSENDIEEKVLEETENEIRFRVRGIGNFNRDTIVSVGLKKSKPRVNAIMGKLKDADKPSDPLVIQSLRFPKEDDWTKSKAQVWIDGHPDAVKSVDDSMSLSAAMDIPEKTALHLISIMISEEKEESEITIKSDDVISGDGSITKITTVDKPVITQGYMWADVTNNTTKAEHELVSAMDKMRKSIDKLTTTIGNFIDSQKQSSEITRKALERVSEAPFAGEPEDDKKELYAELLGQVNEITRKIKERNK